MWQKFLSLILFGSIAAPGAAMACSPANLHPTNAETLAKAQNAFRSATAVIDAVVIDAGSEMGGRIVLRAIRVWKGPQAQNFVVRARNTCDIDYWKKGSRLRLVLNGGPGRYWATQENNGVEYGDPGVFNREIDRLIRNRRPSDFQQPNTRYEH